MNPLDYKPTIPSEFIGPAAQLAVVIQRSIALAQGGALKFLLNGPPGTGKSSLAEFIRYTLGADPRWSTFKFNGTQMKIEMVEEIARSLHLRDLFGNYRMIWIDEADKIPTVAQVRFLTLLDDRLWTAFRHGFFRAPVVDMGLDMFFAVELFGEAEAIERAYHRPGRDHVGEAGIDLRMVGQRQR